MLRNKAVRVVCRLGICVTFACATVSCGSRGSGLPDAVTIELPDGTTTQATLGSGVSRLADTTWNFFATSPAAQGAPFVSISFGPEGNLEAFENNTIAAEIFGSSIFFDGTRHNTTQKGLSYTAATYGAETNDANGFAFEGRMSAFAAGFKVAAGEATASGMFDPDDPNVMTGTFTFGYDIEVNVPGVPTEGSEQSFNFVAQRVVD